MSFLLVISIHAQSIIVCEALGGKILHQTNAYKQRPVASLTKIATAVVALDYLTLSRASLSEKIMVPNSVQGLGGSNPMGLVPGDKLTLRDALTSALVGSDNAAAQTLCEYVGMKLAQKRGENVEGKGEFMREMNALARGLGMTQTYFANAHGMDNAQERGYSTAADLVKLCQYALTKEEISRIVSLKEVKVSKYSTGRKQDYYPSNTNSLVNVDGFKGIKTGMTRLAGGCLASYCARGGSYFISIVLGSDDRFGMTRAVMNEAVVTHEKWVNAGRPITNLAEECVRYGPPKGR